MLPYARAHRGESRPFTVDRVHHDLLPRHAVPADRSASRGHGPLQRCADRQHRVGGPEWPSVGQTRDGPMPHGTAAVRPGRRPTARGARLGPPTETDPDRGPDPQRPDRTGAASVKVGQRGLIWLMLLAYTGNTGEENVW